MPQTDAQRRQIIILFGQRLNYPAEQKLRIGYLNEVYFSRWFIRKYLKGWIQPPPFFFLIFCTYVYKKDLYSWQVWIRPLGL